MDSQENSNQSQDLPEPSSTTVATAEDEPQEAATLASDASSDAPESEPAASKETEIEHLLNNMHDTLKELAEHFSATVDHIGGLLSSARHTTSQAGAETTDTPATEATPSEEVGEETIAEQVLIVSQDSDGDVSIAELVIEVEPVDEADAGPADEADAEPVAMSDVVEILVEVPSEEAAESLAELATETPSAGTEVATGDTESATDTLVAVGEDVEEETEAPVGEAPEADGIDSDSPAVAVEATAVQQETAE
ncbi:MAG: hypothetical protein ACLQUY_27940 [Ktedonobacterales bacterium]